MAITLAGLAAYSVTQTFTRLAQEWPAMQRINHNAQTVSLSEGVGVAAGLIVGQLAAGHGRALVVSLPAAMLGALDDHREDTSHRDKGLAGHIAALRAGRLTTGMAKLLGISTSAVVAAGLLPGRRRLPDIAINSALIAGSANLVNLLDLRPGRALKGAGLLQIPAIVFGTLAKGGASLMAASVGTIAAAAPPDLAGRTMLGDTGANTLGAHTGWVLAATCPRAVRAGCAVVIVGLVLAGEKISFSAVIDHNPILRALDQAGR
ncbi:MAG: hypothetical protein Q4B12_07295 [Bowdeniella nasicola]|nr:hypothetical protein [Bowdeniella nasicola]